MLLLVCRYEREEIFLSLQLPVKSKTLSESLKEFVKGDWLEGDNAYYCEKCEEKVWDHMITRMMSLLMMSLLEGHIEAYVCQGIAPRVNDTFEEVWI